MYSEFQEQNLDIDLSQSDSSELVRGRPLWWEACWYFIGLPLVRSHLVTSSSLRCFLLRLFGARIGKNVYVKPGLKVKFPWYLEVGENTWLGEDLWIDNLTQVTIGANACLSQGAYLCTGNHDWSSTNMRLFVGPITCGDGSWVGAKAVICPGVTVGAGAIVTAGSIANKSIPPFEIHAGNPAVFLRRRVIKRSPVASHAADVARPVAH